MNFLTLNANNKDMRNLHKFDGYIKDGKHVFVMFHMNGCGYCVQALPEWRDIKNNINNKLKNNDNIVIADIESSNLSNIKNAQNIEGFPTIRYIYNYGDSYEDFNGPRVVSELIKWIESKIHNESKVATFKGGKHNKTKKRLSKRQKQNNAVVFDFDLFIKNLFNLNK
jgi:thiol-disulfide isomerase/thioredoxin